MEIFLKEIATKLDSFDIYSAFKEEKNISFLDSTMDPDNLGRYSFIGVKPFLVLKGRKDECYINNVKHNCDVFDKLGEILSKYKIKNSTGIPFIGGCIGYLSYDLGIILEDIKANLDEDILLPHYYFIFYDNLIVFDNKLGKKYISACGILNDPHKSIKDIEKVILKQKIQEAGYMKTGAASFTSNFTKDSYVKTVGKAREYIRSGDIYIANLSQRFTVKTNKDAYDIYRDLRVINPAPFAAFMRLEDFDIISSSPERFLKVRDGKVETRPIKGTRPRGKDKEEDLHYRNELLNSEKDKAELLMIVDLERNDLSKVCKPHSVKVTELFKLEEYSTVFHLVSTVIGTLKDNTDAIQCLKKCFPGGSITGTPKIRAMEIIDELEKLKRSLYTGSIGYFSFDGNADFNIIIRTIIKKDDNVYFGVGGGITWDSDEEAEYQETLDKAKALIKVI
ncbi:MAG: aminodeoxychorismate synthase component I [Anaerocolumna sp.]